MLGCLYGWFVIKTPSGMLLSLDVGPVFMGVLLIFVLLTLCSDLTSTMEHKYCEIVKAEDRKLKA